MSDRDSPEVPVRVEREEATRGGPSGSGEDELCSKMIQIQSKRFYLDVKENKRGRFIKVAEVGAGGRKSRLLMSMSTAAEFRDHLSDFSEHYASLGPPTNSDTTANDGKLKSEVMVKENRRYYLDLKENNRGRFLRVSQTIPRGPRSQIAIPAQGIIEFRDTLTGLLEEYGTEDIGYQGELPEGRRIRVENKNYYFDIGSNFRGVYMRVSEVRSNFRTAITIPEKSWGRFRDIFREYVDKMNELQPKRTSESYGEGTGGDSSGEGDSGGGSRDCMDGGGAGDNAAASVPVDE